MAIRTGNLSLMAGAPAVLSSPVWGYVPFVLITLSGVIWLFRAIRPAAGPADTQPTSTPAPMPNAAPLSSPPPLNVSPDPETLPESFSALFAELKLSDHTDLQEASFLKPHAGKWMIIRAILYELRHDGSQLRAQLYFKRDDSRLSPIFAFFDEKWTDHLSHVRKGSELAFRARIPVMKGGIPCLEDAQVI